MMPGVVRNDDPTGISTPDVMHHLGGDLYATLLGIPTGGSARLTFDTSPLIWMLWLGGVITALGGAISLRSRRTSRPGKRIEADVGV